MRFFKIGLPLITAHEKCGGNFCVLNNARIHLDAGLMKGFHNGFGVRWAPLYGNHFLDVRVILVKLIHALTEQDGFLHARRGRHGLAGEDLHVTHGTPFQARAIAASVTPFISEQ